MNIEELDIQKAKVNQFAAVGIETVEQLVKYIPKKYYDFRQQKFVRETVDGEICAIVGTVYEIFQKPKYVSLKIKDQQNAFLHVYLFGRKYVPACEGERVIVCGQVKINPKFHNVNMYPIYLSKNIAAYQKIIPAYKKIKGMSEVYLIDTLEKAIKALPPQDSIDESIRKEFGLIPEYEAYRKIHRPDAPDDIEAAKKRFVFDDLYAFAKEIHEQKANNSTKTDFPVHHKDSWVTLTAGLSFELTRDQKDRLSEMYQYMKSGHRLNGLLQGDVGSGKTIVATFLLALAAENGFQGCIVAPTEILARQHYDEISNRLAGICSVGILTGSMKAREKKAMLKSVKEGAVQILIGTHAALQKSVEFKNLGMAVVDEQHRFGVEQRDALMRQKHIPHLITMSATPIPRTLSMALYGETIQIYNILTKPNGRKPIETHRLVRDIDVDRVILHEVHAGHQCYVICPLIENSESDKMADVRSVTAAFHKIRSDFRKHPEVKPVMISGNMPANEIAEQIGKFARNEANVLVSTTIVEVGVNIPNATAMIIKNSERFGLAQLHQLRGRVGRSSFQSYCVLQTAKADDKKADIMCSTSDGFEIAKHDLEMRGPGDYIGTKQSGENKSIMLSMAYPEMFRRICRVIEDTDATPKLAAS